MIATLCGWGLIICAALYARIRIQSIYNMPTDIERYRSWRYRQAIRRDVRRRTRS